MKKRSHKKRHGVGRRKSHFARRRHRRARHSQACADTRRAAWLAVSRAYWAGVLHELPFAGGVLDQERRGPSSPEAPQ